MIRNFFGHLHTVNKHRFKVFILCCKCGFIWRGLTHDLSKYSPVEFFEGVKYYAGGKKSPILNCKADIILVDLNNCRDTSFCTDILYLVEPSIIKLNMIMMTIPLTFKNLKGCKLVLNKSLLSPNEINAFANEAGTPIFYNIPPVNDRVENSVLDDLLNNLKLI